MSHIDFQDFIQEQKPKKCILLYHWDCDGIASAAQFLNFIEEVSPETEVVLMTPTLNRYFLDEEEFQGIAALGADGLLTTDINFPPEVIDRLEKDVPQIFVFDHHTQTANIHKPGVQDVNYPGCSMLVNDYLMKPLSLVGILGMVGDQEDKIKERADFFPQIQEMMKEHSLEFDDVQRITKLVDTMYMVGDVKGIEYAVQLLREDPKDALTDQRFADAEKKLKTDMKNELDAHMDEMTSTTGTKLCIQYITATSNIISEVTRARAKQFPDAFIISSQTVGKEAIAYVRTRVEGTDLSSIVESARAKGYNAGGKPEVAGVVLPAEELKEYMDGLISDVIALMP